jgi:hypothetical protein
MFSDKYSDLTLLCHGEEFKVHRVVVCAQSPVLAAACDGGFQVRLCPTPTIVILAAESSAARKQLAGSSTWTSLTSRL